MLGLRKKLIASVATLAMVGLPLATGGAAFAATTSGSSSTSGTSSSTTGSSSTSSNTSSSTSSSTSTTTSTSSTSGVGYTNVGFSDVTSSTPHYNSIEELAALGLVNGFPDGTYQPTANVTRADMAKLIDIALGLQSAASGDTGASNFSDVPAGQWFTGYVNVAAAKGIINGFPDGTFKPNAPVTYAQAVTMVVRALGYEPNVVGPWPSGYMAEAANIENSAKQYTLLNGLTDQLSQTMDRADVARLVANMLYAVPASLSYKLTNGNTQVTSTTAAASTQAAQLGFNLYYPGNDQSSPPLSDCYGNIVTGTILTNPALNPNQVQITTLTGGSCGGAPVLTSGTQNTYTLAPTVAIVGSTNVMDLTGYQVSFATNNQGQVVYIGSVTPKNDSLAGASLGSQLTITPNSSGIGQVQSGITQISIEPSGSSGYQSYNLAAGAVAVPTSGVFKGSNGSNDTITAVLNPNGDVISLIDTDRLTAYKDVYLTGTTTLNGVQTLKFYDGSVTPTNLGIASGAVVTIDGNAATVSDLKKGMILNISVNSQSQATSIAASDKTVTGSISNISVQTTGTTFMTVNGTAYKVRLSSAAYAENGSPVGALSTDVLNGMTNNTATVYIGVDDHIGFIDVTNSNTVVGMALNTVTTASTTNTLEVETGNGGVTAYPLSDSAVYVEAGDLVRLTLNAAGGTATVHNYSEDSTGTTLFGTAAEPAQILGVLGNEIQVKTGPGVTVDLFAPSSAAVFEGSGGGQYAVGNLPTAAGPIAPTASTTTLGAIEPGYCVTLGATPSGVLKGLLYVSGSNTASGCTASAAQAYNTVDVAVPSAATTTSGQLGTVSAAGLGATTPTQLSVESSTNYPQNALLGNDAGTNSSIFQLKLIGQSLVQSITNFTGTSTYATPSDLTESAQIQFNGLTTESGSPAFQDSNGNVYEYGSGTVVVNVPDDQIEPIGSLIPGQTIIVYSQTIPGNTATFAQFVEVVNTATNVGTTTTTSTGTAGSAVTLNPISTTAIGTTSLSATVSGVTYTGTANVYEVTGNAAQNGTGVNNGTVTVSVGSGNGDIVYASAPPATVSGAQSSFVTVTTDGSGNFTAYLIVPQTGTIAESVTANYAGTVSTAQSAPAS